MNSVLIVIGAALISACLYQLFTVAKAYERLPMRSMPAEMVTWIALIIFIIFVLTGQANSAPIRPPQFKAPTHVVFIRGLFGNRYSRGLDFMAARLGPSYRAAVYPHGAASRIYSDIMAVRAARLAFVCHSMGCATTARLLARVQPLGVRACYVAAIDPVWRAGRTKPANARRMANWHRHKRQGSFGPIRGASNIRHPTMTHHKMDDDRSIQARILAGIRACR